MRRLTLRGVRVVSPALALLMASCFAAPAPIESLDVVLPGGVKRTVAAHTGPELLAGGAWAGFRKADEDEPSDPVTSPAPGPYGGLLNGGLLARPPAEVRMYVIDVAEDGRVSQLRENGYFLPEIYGDSSAIDGTALPATIPGMTYSLRSFGTSIDDAMGLAIASDVRFLGLPVGRAVVYAWGTGNTDRIDGQFGYQFDFSEGLGGLLVESGGDQYPFYLVREE